MVLKAESCLCATLGPTPLSLCVGAHTHAEYSESGKGVLVPGAAWGLPPSNIWWAQFCFPRSLGWECHWPWLWELCIVESREGCFSKDTPAPVQSRKEGQITPMEALLRGPTGSQACPWAPCSSHGVYGRDTGLVPSTSWHLLPLQHSLRDTEMSGMQMTETEVIPRSA